MWADWKRLVNVKRIMENELPHGCAHEEVYNILSSEIRAMLLPLKTEMWLPDGTFYQEPVQEAPDLTNETVIDRIAAFLTKLPSRFPNAPARTMLHCVNAIGSAALREITVENGQSFQGWWLTKVFIDEMGQWLASLGGFLAHNPPNWSPLSYSPGLMGESNTDIVNERSGSNNDSRYSSIDAEFGTTQNQNFMTNGNGTMSVTAEPNTNTESKCWKPVTFDLFRLRPID
jgi:regulatory factor X